MNSKRLAHTFCLVMLLGFGFSFLHRLILGAKLFSQDLPNFLMLCRCGLHTVQLGLRQDDQCASQQQETERGHPGHRI